MAGVQDYRTFAKDILSYISDKPISFEVFSDEIDEMEEQIEDYLADNQKINAIKYYRSEMKDRFDEEVSLRDAKDYVDQIHHDMRRRGVITR